MKKHNLTPEEAKLTILKVKTQLKAGPTIRPINLGAGPIALYGIWIQPGTTVRN
jgi:hypothetical protein